MSGVRRIVRIDLAELQSRKSEVTAELMAAAEDIGFFQVSGHGISQSEIDAAFAASRSFLSQPDDFKKTVEGSKDNFAYALGWTHEDIAGNRLRSGIFTGFDHERMQPYWPSEERCPNFKQDVLTFMHRCNDVTQHIMACFALGLGLPEDFFAKEMDPHADDNQTAMFMNHYPSTDGKTFPEGVLRIAAHTDFELLTLLFNEGDVAGLEVLPGKETSTAEAAQGHWTPVNPQPGCITVNIGDALQYWSDDRLKSTFHRVRVPRADEFQGDRYSLAYFANAKASTVFQGPARKYPPIKFEEILAKKAAYSPAAAEGRDLTDEEQIEMMRNVALGPEWTADKHPEIAAH